MTQNSPTTPPKNWFKDFLHTITQINLTRAQKANLLSEALAILLLITLGWKIPGNQVLIAICVIIGFFLVCIYWTTPAKFWKK